MPTQFYALKFLLLLFLINSLSGQPPENVGGSSLISERNLSATIASRFPPPPGFVRLSADPGSYAEWLRLLPLLPENSPVKDYRSRIWKGGKDTTVAAVVDWDIAGRKLEQCMDIIIRLRAEFLFETGQPDNILFLMPDRSELKWSDWRQGLRPQQQGWGFPLRKTAAPDDSRKSLENYLNCLFNYSDTQTYYFGLDSVQRRDVQIGDFIVKRGKKGHAVVIVDMARSAEGELRALIAQGDTPACQLYILNYRQGDPWIPLNFSIDVIPLPIRKEMSWDGLRRFVR